MRVLGAVLAGGRSTRFGSDKVSALWRDRPLIEHVLAAVRPHVDAVIVCGREWPGEVGVPDRPRTDLGPLGGLNAALHHAAASGFDRVLSVPCDTPTLAPELLRSLLGCEANAIVAELPVAGIWSASLSDALDLRLASGGDRSLRGWAEKARAIRVSAGPIPNVNRPGDLDALGG